MGWLETGPCLSGPSALVSFQSTPAICGGLTEELEFCFKVGQFPSLTDLDLPWAALEVPVRDWGFAGSPGAGQLPVLGTWIYGPTAATLPGALRGD